MRKNVITGLGLMALSAGMAQAGGWEASRLSTGIMYESGSRAELSMQSITYDVNGTTQNGLNPGTTHKMAKDQNRTNIGL